MEVRPDGVQRSSRLIVKERLRQTGNNIISAETEPLILESFNIADGAPYAG